MTKTIAVDVVAEFHQTVKVLATDVEDVWRGEAVEEYEGAVSLIAQGRFEELFDDLITVAEDNAANWDTNAAILSTPADDVEALQVVVGLTRHVEKLSALANLCSDVLATKSMLPSLTWPEGFVIEGWTHEAEI